MKSFYKQDYFIGLFLAIIAVGFIITYFFPIKALETFISLLIVIFIAGTLPSLTGSIRNITYLLLIAAIIMFLVAETPLEQWLVGIRGNLTMVSILIFAPLLGIPIRLGGYIDSLKLVFEQLNTKLSTLFIGTKALTHILSLVLNIGSVSVVYYLSKAAPVQSTNLFAKAMSRGFSLSILWSPYFAAMAIVLSLLPITLGAILPYSLGFVCICFFISFILEFASIRKEDITFESISPAISMSSKEERKSTTKKNIELVLLLLFMLIIVLGIESISSLSMVIIICLVALLFSLLWSLLYRKLTGYIEELQNHISGALPRMKNEVVLFLVSGFFSAAFIKTNFSSSIILGLNEVFNGFLLGIAYSVVLAIIISSVLGLHPIIPVSILAASFDPNLLGFSPEFFGVLLLGSWAISNTISPATAVNNLLASLYGIEVTKISFQWNLKYALILAVILPLYLQLVQL